MNRDDMRECQSKRLIDTIHRVYHNVPAYWQKMKQINLLPEDIKSVDDLSKLPYTTKQDLRDNYPFEMFAVPLSDIVRIHASSGTTGKPTVVGYTKNDLDIWSEVVARTLTSAGAHLHDIVHVAYGYGLFTGGLGLHYGSEKIGATVIPISGGNTQRQIQLMHDFGSTVLACTPSYALFLAEAIDESPYKREQLKLRVGVFGAEPWTEIMRQEIEAKLRIKAIDIYGLSEVIGPGVSSECEYQCGLHVFEDHFIPEIINPDTLEVMPKGEKGELVFTCITKEALPLIRYRTRDITRLIYEPCKCGRTLVRMEKCSGRSDDMLIIRGVNVFPSQIEEILLHIEGIHPHYLITVDRVNNLDQMHVQVEVEQEFFSDRISELQVMSKKIQQSLESTLGISIDVKLVEPKSITRSEGKAIRVIDKRKLV